MSGKFHTPGGGNDPQYPQNGRQGVAEPVWTPLFGDGVQSDRDLQQSPELHISLTERGVT
jgi:hypothetical protein